MQALFQIVQLVYWLALSTWFGGVLFIMLAAPIILRTVRENNPILTHVLSVNLDGQHSTLLAGNIVSSLVQRLLNVQIVCAALLLIALILHPFVLHLNESNRMAAVARSALFIGAAAVMMFDWQVVWPKIRSNREQYIAHADEPEIANPALDRYDAEQRKSLTLVMISACLLGGMILFSSSYGAFAVAPNN